MNIIDVLLTVIIGAALVTLLIYPFLSNEGDENLADCGITGGKCTGDDPSCECRECMRPVGCPNCDHYRSCK